MEFEEFLKKIKDELYLLKYLKNPTPEMCLASIKKDGCNLRFVKDQTPEICLEAVKQDSNALEFVKDQTLEICLAAVKQNSNAIRYVNKPIAQLIKAVSALLEACEMGSQGSVWSHRLLSNASKIMRENGNIYYAEELEKKAELEFAALKKVKESK